MKGPSEENEFAKKAKKMKYNNTMDPDRRDVGASTKVRAEKVSIVDSKTGKVYGTRTLVQKTTEQKTLLSTLLNVITEDSKDVTLLPLKVVGEIKKNISAGAKDLQQAWKNALELTNKAYQVTNVRLPAYDQRGAWKQYEEMIRHAVLELSKARGLDSGWRITDTVIRETQEMANGAKNHIGKKRFFVDIPGAGTAEIDAKNMDEIIDSILNKLRRHGAVGRVEERSDEIATVSMWVHGVKRDQVTVKHIS